ncbi:regulator [Saccharicrinis sp. FJH54]|uniref:regulator n=1 Tax=Saccharicrinis sp. FJH54 TaxID=3344665 RepID=UPI0035D3D986
MDKNRGIIKNNTLWYQARWAIFLFFLLFQISMVAEVRPFKIINFNKNEYKAGSQNWSIAFDSDGYTYIGNTLGLLEFDGVTWHLYHSPNGSIIRTVAVDKNNRVYSGGYRELGYWERNDSGQLIYTSLTSSVEKYFPANEEFWNILVVDGKVYFHSFSGIYIYQDGNFTVLNNYGYINFATSSKDEIYCSVKNVGIFRVGDKELIPVTKSTFLRNKNIRFIYRKDSVHYLIGTESHGIYLYSTTENSFVDFAPQLRTYLSQTTLNHGIVTSNGNILIGTIVDGLAVLDDTGKLRYRISKESGLQNNTVLGISTDKNGNIWLALDNGIGFISFPDVRSHVYVHLNEMGAIYTSTLYNGNLYLGTNQGLFAKPQDAVNEKFTLVPGTQDQVWDCKIIDQKLFVGHNSGTYIVNGLNAEKISANAGGYSIIRYPQNPDLLLQCTYSNLVFLRKVKGRWQYSHTVEGFNNLIRFIEFDHLNNLWASHLYQGIYKIRLSEKLDSVVSVEYFDRNSVLGKEGHNAHVFKIENRIVFTGYDRLYTYDDLNDSIVPFQSLNEQLGKFAVANRIIAGPEHRYWFVNKSGIACFEIIMNNVTLLREFPIALFNNQLIPGYENIVPLDKESAMVCMEDGYTIINTRFSDEGFAIEKNEIKLREAQVFDKNGDGENILLRGNRIRLPFNKNSLFLRFSFPFISAEKLTYVYEVDGLTERWSDPMDEPVINLNRIPPGDYTLHIKAINGWGRSSPVLSQKITVDKPFYQSIYAIFFYITVMGILLFVTRSMTIKRVQLHERRKRDEKEKELIQLRNEKLQAELSFKSEQLANSTMGIIKKNEFLMSIKRKLKRQKEQLGNRFPEKYYKDLMDKIDQNISGHDDWKLFEHNFEKAHEAFLKTLKANYPDLTPGDLRLCAYLKLNLSSKEIAPLLGVSVRGVENHRYRLRKKFNLSKEANLTEFILAM